ESLLRAIRKLDVFPRQVLIEVLIAEITLNDSLQLGVDWVLTSGSSSGTLTGDTALTPASGLVYAITRADEVKATIKALAANKRVNVISAPLLLAAENQESRISVGDEIPIITTLTTSQNLDTDTGKKISDRSIKYRDTGIILSVVPRINDSGLVKLTISQEISEVSSTSYGSTESPSFSKRTATTNVITTDNQSVVIAGLIKTSNTEQDSGIPFIKDIPLLGNLFKVINQVKQRTELVITLTPYVIHDMADAKQIIADLKEELKRIREGQAAGLPQRGGARQPGPAAN
ncbi:MAG: type II secretion system protein GspD, partial [Desulfovibrio sp.]|nr:type II secretion system protein GspD [Desulfovibrio sp.]